MHYSFEWDLNKARQNLVKHGLSFEKAASIFRDPNAISIFDDDHSQSEERWLTLGLDSSANLIVLSHTFEYQDEKNCRIRMISARQATKSESLQYKGD